MTTLVLGGARSGKSAYAEGLLPADDATYVATARHDPDDAEWQQRIATHVARRPPGWRTVEPDDLPDCLISAEGPVIVDDVATWLTGVMDDHDAWNGDLDAVDKECGRLVEAVTHSCAALVLVTA